MIVIQRVSLFYGTFQQKEEISVARCVVASCGRRFLHHVRVIGSVQAVCKYLLTDGARLPAP